MLFIVVSQQGLVGYILVVEKKRIALSKREISLFYFMHKLWMPSDQRSLQTPTRTTIW